MGLVVNVSEMQLMQFPGLTPLDFCLGGSSGEVYKRKVDTPDELLNCSLAFWTMLHAQRKVKVNPDEKHAMLAHELRSVLRLTVGFFEHLLWNYSKTVI